MKVVRGYKVVSGLLRSNGDQAQVGDTVTVFLDIVSNPSYPESIDMTIKNPISKICDGYSYVFEYDYEGVIQVCDILDVVVLDCCALLEERINSLYFFPESYIGNDFQQIQSAIDAAIKVNGKVVLAAKTYTISDELIINGSCSIEGVGCFPNWGDRSEVGVDIFPSEAPYLTGSVILQTGAGKNGIKITAVGRCVNIRGIGIRFDDSIKFTDTGHGIHCDPGAFSFPSGHPNAGQPAHTNIGIAGFVWDNVMVYGHDGDHYGHNLINAQLGQLLNCQSYGGGGLHWHVDTPTGWYGNSVVDAYYNCLSVGGTAHGFYLSSVFADHGVLYLTLIRPQTFVYGTREGISPPINSGQHCFYADDNAAWFHVLGPNMEEDGSWSSAVRLPTDMAEGSWFGCGGQGIQYERQASQIYMHLPTYRQAPRTLMFERGTELVGFVEYAPSNNGIADIQNSMAIGTVSNGKVMIRTNNIKRMQVTDAGTTFYQGVIHTGATTPAFLATLGGTSPSSSTSAIIGWDNLPINVTGAFAAGKFTPLVPGRYTFQTMITFENMLIGNQIEVELWKNGSLLRAMDFNICAGDGYNSVKGTGFDVANGINDYYEVRVKQNSGSNKNVVGFGGTHAWWSGTLTN